MAKVTLTFTDTEDGQLETVLDVVEEGDMNDESKPVPISYIHASLLAYIIEQGYHEQYVDEFFEHLEEDETVE